MRQLTILLFIIIYSLSYAQNYELVKPNQINYFIDSENAIHEFMVDSTSVIGNDTIYKSFPRIRNFSCYIDMLGSIFGNTIIKQQDSLYLIVNAEFDTTLIKVNSTPGEKWVCFNNFNNQYIEAECSSILFENVLGVMDSVKTISFSLKDTFNTIVSSPINDLKLKLSKNYGLVSMVDFSLFPFVEINANYFNLNSYAEQNAYSQLDLESISVLDFDRPDYFKHYYFNFDIGDIIQEKHTWYYNDKEIIINEFEVLNKTVFIDSIVYEVFKKTSIQTIPFDYYSSYSYNESTIKWVVDLQEKIVEGSYFESDSLKRTTFTFISDSARDELNKFEFELIPNLGSGDLTSCSVNRDVYTYIQGVGGPYFSVFNGTPDYHSVIRNELIYYKKGSTEWGSYFPVSINKIDNESNRIKIFPNPNYGNFKISLNKFISPYTFKIYNLLGELVLSERVESESEYIESSLLKGIYIVRIENEGNILKKRLLVN